MEDSIITINSQSKIISLNTCIEENETMRNKGRNNSVLFMRNSSSGSKYDKIKRDLVISFRSVTAHGLPNLTKSKYILQKIIWSILLSASSVFTFYFIINCIMEFYEHNVTTVVRLKNYDQIEFPSVTICNKNKLTTKDTMTSLFQKLQVNLSNFKHENESFRTKMRTEIYNYMQAMPASFLNQNSIKTSISLQDILLFCRFNHKDCNQSDFVEIFNEYFGSCFIFNSNLKQKDFSTTKRTVRFPGEGLFIALNAALHSQFKLLDIEEPDKGFYVFIDNKNPFVYSLPIFVPTVYKTDVKMHLSEFQKYPKPYSDCDFTKIDDLNNLILKDSTYKDEIVTSNYSYTQELCFEVCKAYFVSAKCNCTKMYSSLQIPNLKKCTSENSVSEVNCSDKYYISTNYFNDYMTFSYENCSDMCPLECNQTKYDYLVEKSIQRSKSEHVDNFKKLIIEKKDFQNINDSFGYGAEQDLSFLHIYYEKMSQMTYKEIPTMSGYTLLSNIGGSLGLFLGMSLLSLAEFLEIFFNLVYQIIKLKPKVNA